MGRKGNWQSEKTDTWQENKDREKYKGQITCSQGRPNKPLQVLQLGDEFDRMPFGFDKVSVLLVS